MNLDISETAAKWYKEELDLIEHDSLRFFVRYGGDGNQPGFSLAVNVETPQKPIGKTISNGIVFFVEESDEWYFDGSNLEINFDENINEPIFLYK